MQDGTGQVDDRDMLTKYGVRRPQFQGILTNRIYPVIARLMRTDLWRALFINQDNVPSRAGLRSVVCADVLVLYVVSRFHGDRVLNSLSVWHETR
jgi:hypothetical protein